MRSLGADLAITYQRHRAGLFRTETCYIVGQDGVTAVPPLDRRSHVPDTPHMIKVICDRMDDSDLDPSEAGALH